MRQRLPVTLLLMAIVAVVAWLLWDVEAGSPDWGTDMVIEPGLDPARTAVAVGGEGDTATPRSDRRELREPLPDGVAPSPGNIEDTRAEIRGRFLLPDGTPAAGVVVRTRGFAANSERARQYGLPDEWSDPSSETDDEGRFAIRFDPPPAYQFSLHAEMDGYAKESWRWNRIGRGSIVDVGTVTLRSAGAVVGTIVDADGQPVADAWQVFADATRVSTEGKDATRVHAPYDPASGRFRLDGLPPGPAQLHAASRIAGSIHGPVVDVVAGREVAVKIVYDGPDQSRRIVVDASCRPFHTEGVDGERVQLSAPGQPTRTAPHVHGSSRSHAFDDLDPGSYTVEIDDPRFRPWSQAGIEPGSRVNARLVGNASARLDVVDARTGAAVDSYTLDVRLDQSHSSPNVFRIREAGDELPDGGIYEGLLPMDQTLLVHAAGYSIHEVSITDLQPREVRSVRAELRPSSRIAGTVREKGRPDPLSDVRVWLLPLGADPTEGRVDGEPPPVQREARTDAAGRFEFADVSAGDHSVVVRTNPWVIGRLDVRELEAGEQRTELVVELAATASLSGRLIAPDGAEFTGLRVVATPLSETPDGTRMARAEPGLTVQPDSEGGFRLRWLPTGAVQLGLVGPEVMLPRGNNSQYEANPPALTFARLELEAGEDVVTEFDLRESWPGSIQVTVQRDGAAGAGLVVEVSQLGAVRGAHTGASTAPDGSATIGSLSPGEYRVRVRSFDRSWLFEMPGTVAVAAGETASVAVHVVLCAGTLRLLDETTGDPLSNRKIRIQRADGRAGLETDTDADGCVRLDLPEGDYRVLLATDSHRWNVSGASLQWTATGPVPGDVRLAAD